MFVTKEKMERKQFFLEFIIEMDKPYYVHGK